MPKITFRRNPNPRPNPSDAASLRIQSSATSATRVFLVLDTPDGVVELSLDLDEVTQLVGGLQRAKSSVAGRGLN